MDGTVVSMTPAARYSVDHVTRYAYTAPVSQSWQLARLTPRALPWQRLVAHSLHIEPNADERRDEADSFGNTVTHFALHGAHRVLTVRMACLVDVGVRPPGGQAANSAVAWESVRNALRQVAPQADLEPARLCEPSSLLPLSDAAHAYASASFPPGRGWFDAVYHLMQRIHAEFEFEPGSTTVNTSADEVLAQRSGVCQDFAHLMLACLRSHGLPARYVSGYLLTEPPPGRPRLVGVDATHAWVAAHAPGHGWVEFDPTNDQLADTRYITLGWGADFADVAPLRGVFFGGGEQRLHVAVTVAPA